MRPLTITATARGSGSAAPRVVWRRYARFAQWPAWSHHFADVRATRARIAPGVTGTARIVGPLPVRPVLRLLGGIPARFTVLAVDRRHRRWSWQLGVGPVSLVLRHTVSTRSDGSGAATTTTVTALAPLVLCYLPVSRAALRRITRG